MPQGSPARDNKIYNYQFQFIMRDILFSGTLGDAFIVICKVYNIHQKTGERFNLFRYSIWPGMDSPIRQLTELTGFIEYPEKCRTVKNVGETIREVVRAKEPYINPSWNGYTPESWNQDPDGINMEPFPSLNLDSWHKENTKNRIGIQLHSGQVGGNFKGLSLNWVDRILKFIPRNEYEIHFFGTGDGLNQRKINRICLDHGINNHIGKTDFKQWLSMLAGLDFLITPEGFPAFFAMSQRVKTLVFYTDYQILGRVHPEWRKRNILMSAGWRDMPSRIYNLVYKSIYRRAPDLAPIKPEQVYSLIHSQFSYLESC